MTGKIRIIGGQWRGRRLKVLERPGLRPTSDRLRETLFNWLMPMIEGSFCLDLFAGSGALGIEAASRKAKQVVLVEKDKQSVKNLIEHIHLLAADCITVVSNDALKFLRQSPATKFDLVFLDPPFGQDLLTPCCSLLEQLGWLNTTAYVYLELESQGVLNLPPSWEIIRHTTAGQATGYLAVRQGNG